MEKLIPSIKFFLFFMNLSLMYRYKLLGAAIKEEIRTCGAVVLLAE